LFYNLATTHALRKFRYVKFAMQRYDFFENGGCECKKKAAARRFCALPQYVKKVYCSVDGCLTVISIALSTFS
jgi:hypothetical protein